MADDIQSNININIDTSQALASIQLLQAQISAFHTQMSKLGAVNASNAASMQQNLLTSINASGKFAASITTIKSSAESFTAALEKNKLSLGEYFRYAGASSKSFGKYFTTEFETINKVARERVKDLQTQYIKLGRDANGAMQAIKVRPLVLDMENLSTKTQIAAQRQQLLNQVLKQGSTNLLNFGKNTQWAGRQLMVGFTIPLTIMGGAAVKAYQQMEEAAVKFKRVYGDMNTTNANTDEMVKQVQRLALEYTKYGIAVKDTMDMAASAAAMGKQGSDLLQQISSANKLSALGGVDQNKALQTTISLTNAFSISSKDLGKNIDFLNAVENQTVLNIDDMTTAIPKAAPVIKQLGGNVKDLAFFLTAMKEGGVNASEGANALKSGLSSLINPTNAAKTMLQSLGINITGIVQKDKGNLRKTVIDFAQALDKLDPLQRAQAIEKMFGKFQFARISTLFQNITQQGTQASKVLDLANSSSVDLALMSQQELKKVQDSPLFQFKKAIADFQNSLAPIGQQFLQVVTPIIKFGQSLLDGFNNLNGGVKQFIIQVVGIGGIIGPVLLMTFGLIANAVANVNKGFSLVKDLFNKTGKSSLSLGEQVDYMTQSQIEAAAVASSLEQVHSRLKQSFTAEAAAVNELTAAYERSVAAQRAFGGIPAMPSGPIRKYATGGIIRGPGTGTSDSIVARLSNGEAVIPAHSVARHPDIVHSLISGTLPGFAKGGIISPYAGKTYNVGPSREELGLNNWNFDNSYLEFLNKVNPLNEQDAQQLKTLNDMVQQSGGNWKSLAPGLKAAIMDKLAIHQSDNPNLLKPMHPDTVSTQYGISNLGSGMYFSAAVGERNQSGKNNQWGKNEYRLSISDKALKQTIAGKGYISGWGLDGILEQKAKNWIKNNGPKSPVVEEILQYLEEGGLDPYSASIGGKVSDPFIQSLIKDGYQGLEIGPSEYVNWNVGTNPGYGLKKNKFATGGLISGPGTGTSDSILARVSNGEAIIPAKQAQKYSGLINGMISGNIPGFSQGTEFAHIGDKTPMGTQDVSEIISQNPSAVSVRMSKIVEGLAQAFGNAFRINLYGKLGIRTGNTEDGKSINNMLGKNGVSKKEFLQDFDKQGISKWKDSVKFANLKMSDVKDSLTVLDSEFRKQIKAIHKTIIKDEDLAIAYKKAADLVGGPLVKSFNQLQKTIGEARVNLSQSWIHSGNFPMAEGGGSKGAVLVNDMKIRKSGDRFVFYNQEGFVIATEAQEGILAGVRKATKQASPSKEAKRVGENIGIGAIQGIESVTPKAKVAGEEIGQTIVSGARTSRGANANQNSSTQSGSQTIIISGDVPLETGDVPLKKGLGAKSKNFLGRATQKVLGSGMQGSLIGFAASSVLGMMSNISGPIGQISGQLAGFSTAISSVTMLLPLLGEGAIAAISSFAVAAAPAVIALGLLGAGIYFWVQSEKDRLEKLKAATAGYTASLYGAAQAQASANIFGYTQRTASSNKFAIGPNAPTSVKGISEQNTIDKVIKTSDFQNAYKDIVNSTKNISSVSEMNNSLYLIGLQNMAEGNSEAGAMTLIKAIQKAAGKMSVALNFKSLSLDTPNGQKQLSSSISQLLGATNSVKPITTNTLTIDPGSLTEYYKPHIQYTEEDLNKLEIVAKGFKTVFQSLGTAVNDGTISLNTYNSSMDNLYNSIEKSSNSAKLFSTILKKFPSEIQKAFAKIQPGKNIGFEPLLKAAMMGVTVSQDIIDNLASGTHGRIKQGLKDLQDAVNAQIKIQQAFNQMLQDSKPQSQKNLDIWNAKISNLNGALDIISRKETKINKSYDDRIKALDDIQKANDTITQQQQDQLDLADALSKGDIAAAARAQSKMSADSAKASSDAAKASLEQGRQNALASVSIKDSTGKSYNRTTLESMINVVQDLIDSQTLGGYNFTNYKTKTVGGNATGGHIKGPGSGTSDSIPAMLSNGEYVVRANAVKTIGVNTLDKLNQADRIGFKNGGYNGYANGGLVGYKDGGFMDTSGYNKGHSKYTGPKPKRNGLSFWDATVQSYNFLKDNGFDLLDPTGAITQGKFVADLVPRVRDIRRGGAGAVDLCFVASGAVDGFFESSLNEWDVAAGGLIAREAGAVLSGRNGGPANKEMTILAGPSLHAQLVREIG